MCNSTGNLSILDDCTNDAGATILSPVLMSLTGVLGNILALYQLYTTRTDVRTTKFYSLIAGLAWTDLLGILMTSPSVILAYVNNRQWVGGDANCRFHGFTMVTFGLATPLIICAMAVERFLALKCVFFYSSRCRTGTARVCILILWFGVILYGLLPLFGLGTFEKQYPGTWCFLDFHSDTESSMIYGYIYACTTLVLILIIFLCNAYVMITIFKTRFKRERSESVHVLSNNLAEQDVPMNVRATRRKSNDSDIQMIVLLCAITVVFTVCWAPLTLRIIITQAIGTTNVLLDLAAIRLASLNQTLDPWLYILIRRSTFIKLSGWVRRIQRKYILVRDIDDQNLAAQYQNDNDNMCNEKRCNLIPKGAMKTVNCDIRSPKSDVTNGTQNENRDYVCQLQFGKSVLPDQEDGIYVKILYLPTMKVQTNACTPKQSEHTLSMRQMQRTLLRDSCDIPISTTSSKPTDHPNNRAVLANCSRKTTKQTVVSKNNLKNNNLITPNDRECIFPKEVNQS